MRDSFDRGGGGVLDGLRLAVYQTLSIECPLSFSGVYFVLLFLYFCCLTRSTIEGGGGDVTNLSPFWEETARK